MSEEKFKVHSRSGNVSRRTSQTNFSHIYVRSLEESTPVSIALARAEVSRREGSHRLPSVEPRRKTSMYGTAGSIWIKSRLSDAGSNDDQTHYDDDLQDFGSNPDYSTTSAPIDWIRAPVSHYKGGLPRRRSLSQPPPVGSPGKAWGRFDTIAEILNRPQALPSPVAHERKSLAKHGGSWSHYVPVSRLYLDSRSSLQTPGPGDYGIPDPILSSKPSPFSKSPGGRFSPSRLETERERAMRLSAEVPGPGHYDCEHVFGLARRIALASPTRPARPAGAALGPTVRLGPDGAIRPHSTPTHPLLGGAGGRGTGGAGRGGGGEDGGEDGGELVLVLDPVRHEQRLVMSSRVPARKMARLESTRYSRLRKETHAPVVQRVRRAEVCLVGSDSDSSDGGF